MSSGPIAEADIQELLNECAVRLSDYRPTDDFTLRRFARELEAALPDAPEHLRGAVYGQIGTCRYKLGDIQRAMDAHQTALRLDPFSPDHLNNVACCELALGQPADALRHLRRARVMPNVPRKVDVRLWVNEVEVLIKLRDLVQAGRAFEAGVHRVEPDDALNLLNLTKAAADLGRENDCVEILARFVTAVEQAPRGADQPAVEFVRMHAAAAAPIDDPAIREMLGRALARWDAPTPVEYQDRAGVELSPEAWAKFCDLAGLAPEQ